MAARTGPAAAPRRSAARPGDRTVRFMRRTGDAFIEVAPALLLLAALLLIWEALVRAFDTPHYILPAPTRVWDAFGDVRGTLPGHTRTTLTEALVGLLAAIGVALPLALLVASVSLVRRVLYPVLVVSQTIPMIVLAPLLLIWVGYGLAPKVIVVALVGFFPIVVSTVEGLTRADRDMVDLVRSMGANRWQVMRHVSIPAAIPSFFAGLKIAAAYAVTGAVIGEWVVADEGLGVLINRSRAAYRIDQVFVAIAVISAASIALFALVHVLARLASPWMYVRNEEES